jgi:hypothetical protein
MALTQEQLRKQAEKRIAADTPSGIARGKPSTDRLVKAAQDELVNQQEIENAKNYEVNTQQEENDKLASVGLAAPSQNAVATPASMPQSTQFVSQSNPAQAQSVNSELMMPTQSQGEQTAIAGLNAQGIATAQGEAQKALVYDSLMKQEADRAKQEEERAAAFAQKSNELMADVERTKQEISNFKFEEPSIWKNKTTPQKILFGISAFLGSITPQGANNIVKMIDDELNRDIASQKTEYEKLGDKLNSKQNTYKMYYDKYKDETLAAAAAKNSRLDMVKLHLEKIASTTNSKVVLGRTQEAIGKIQMEQDSNFQKMAIQLQKSMAKGNAQVIPGYDGNIKDDTARREFSKKLTSAKSAKYEINNLLGISKQFLGGALSLDARDSAKQSQALLLGQLREILVGPGSMSEGDRALMEEAIANPTSLFTRSSGAQIKLNKLQDAINRSVDADAAFHGLVPKRPVNAREID